MENGKEKEEGEIHEWQRVSQVKASRTPMSHDLKYGQVMIATPSRYAALSNSGENGENIEHEEIEGLEEEDGEVVEEGTIKKMIEDAIKKVEESKGSNSRQMLPRMSKTNHKVLPSETSIQVGDKKFGAAAKIINNGGVLLECERF